MEEWRTGRPAPTSHSQLPRVGQRAKPGLALVEDARGAGAPESGMQTDLKG
jgi:hypothetical protein